MNSHLLTGTGSFPGSTGKMPVLFLGHGSPMNAIEENSFVEGFRQIASLIPKPDAILCISAHWETRGTLVTAMKDPPTIHDFGGFPEKLFNVRYPAPGSPELAATVRELVKKTDAVPDLGWGLDHGTWSVVKHLYPSAEIPVVQLSLDYFQTTKHHYELATELAPLRNKGVLIIGSGNIVHNLGMIDWAGLNREYGYDWALEANEKVRKNIIERNHEKLINYHSLGREFRLAVPTPEHYLPLIYCLGLSDSHDDMRYFNDSMVAGSISMTSLLIASR